jgi:hypothetical protein
MLSPNPNLLVKSWVKEAFLDIKNKGLGSTFGLMWGREKKAVT